MKILAFALCCGLSLLSSSDARLVEAFPIVGELTIEECASEECSAYAAALREHLQAAPRVHVTQ